MCVFELDSSDCGFAGDLLRAPQCLAARASSGHLGSLDWKSSDWSLAADSTVCLGLFFRLTVSAGDRERGIRFILMLKTSYGNGQGQGLFVFILSTDLTRMSRRNTQHIVYMELTLTWFETPSMSASD